MKLTLRGLLIAGLHVALVCSLGAKLLYDRATRPRVWVRAAPYDPDLPIRGRYVSLRLQMSGIGFAVPESRNTEGRAPARVYANARLEVQNGQLVAVYSDRTSDPAVWEVFRDSVPTISLFEPVAFFIPEHIQDPSRRPAGEELWVEVTLPRKGPPRPIRLAVIKNGVFTPLDIR
ncbi:MAG TPA: hypothetical protein VGR03_13250 [Candidatus Acidoferrum sp.]|nr:hypothetical protein [Candidatus Acidoferrum sp.]